MTAVRTGPATGLDELRFEARTNPLGPAVDVGWHLPVDDPDSVSLTVLRRERRYPGLTRRGTHPVDATASDLTDGVQVYSSAAFTFDFEEVRREWEGADLLVTTQRQYRYRGTPADRELVRVIRSSQSARGAWLGTTVRIIDQGVAADTRYYYTAFVGATRTYSRATQSNALATGRSATGLFHAMPEVDRVRDTDTPDPFTVARADREKGQLQRYLETFDAHADMLRGLVRGHGDLHDLRRVDARLLPGLAELIGWELQDFLDEDAQRVEIGFATEVYRTVGTARTVAAMVNRLTGWDARVREFVRNVLITFDTTRREQLDAGVMSYSDGSTVPRSPAPPYLRHRAVPPGTLDTTDSEAMFRVRNRLYEDAAAYTYDCGTRTADGSYQRGEDNWYSRDTIGIYIVPDVDTELFKPQSEWDRIRGVLRAFLPINIRAVFILLPGVSVEEEYDAAAKVVEEATDRMRGGEDEEAFTGADESGAVDRIPNWIRLYSNKLEHRSVDTRTTPVTTAVRTWHTGIS